MRGRWLAVGQTDEVVKRKTQGRLRSRMQIVAVSPQAKDRLFKSVRRYLTDFAAGERPRDFELPFWLRWAFVPT